MELACPNCTTRFAVPENAVGPDGRKVRCSNCDHVWHAMPEDLIQPLTDFAPEPPAAYAPPSAAPVAAPAPTTTWEAPPAPAAEPTPRDRRPTPRPYVEPRRSNGWLVIGILLMAAVAALYVLRVQVVERLPQAAEIYRLAGIPMATIGTELKLVDVGIAGHSVNTLPQIRVEGLIQNDTDEPLDIPAIELTLLDKAGAALTNRLLQPPQARIDARSIVRFQYDLDGDVSEVGRVNIRFQQ